MLPREGMPSNNLLELKEVYKDFDGLEVLSGVNLKVVEGTRMAVIGPNGAGKSTLFNLITGKFKPRKGEIFFKGESITGSTPYRLNRRGMSRSFQITNIFRTMTVFDNIRNAVLSKNNIRYNFYRPLSGMTAIQAQTEQVLQEIGLLERRALPAGLLSYGEQRALEIGLTIATEPDMILLDEPTAGMSSEETREAIQLISRISEGKTLIIVEHDMEVVFSLADTISVLYYGKILASGPPEVIRQDQRVKDAYLGEKQE